MILLSFSNGNFLMNGTGPSFLFFLLGMPITVFSEPLGLPLFLSFGGISTSDNSTIVRNKITLLKGQ